VKSNLKDIILSRTFTLELPASADDFLEYAREKASQKGFRFKGTSNNGSFDGFGITGRYEINGNTLIMVIDNKPAFIPWSVIENKLDDFARTGS